MPYIVDTDASLTAVGGVLSQEQDGVERVIAYASTTLNRAQRSYCVTLRELLAIKYCVVDQWQYYLINQEFTLRVDHSALAWLWRSTNRKDMYQ